MLRSAVVIVGRLSVVCYVTRMYDDKNTEDRITWFSLKTNSMSQLFLDKFVDENRTSP